MPHLLREGAFSIPPMYALSLLKRRSQVDLLLYSLWPEEQKLYGHGNAAYCVASAHRCPPSLPVSCLSAGEPASG